MGNKEKLVFVMEKIQTKTRRHNKVPKKAQLIINTQVS